MMFVHLEEICEMSQHPLVKTLTGAAGGRIKEKSLLAVVSVGWVCDMCSIVARHSVDHCGKFRVWRFIVGFDMNFGGNADQLKVFSV